MTFFTQKQRCTGGPFKQPQQEVAMSLADSICQQQSNTD